MDTETETVFARPMATAVTASNEAKRRTARHAHATAGST